MLFGVTRRDIEMMNLAKVLTRDISNAARDYLEFSRAATNATGASFRYVVSESEKLKLWPTKVQRCIWSGGVKPEPESPRWPITGSLYE